MLTIFVKKIIVKMSTINYYFVFSLGQIVIFASCIVGQVAPSGLFTKYIFHALE